MTMDASLMAKILETMIELKSMTKSLAFHGVVPSAFSKYMHENPAAENEYVRAQAVIAEMLVEDIISIADEEKDAAKARNRIDARRWYASKTKPHKFGDRIDLNINQVVDIGSALAEARKRVIDVTPKASHLIDKTKQVTTDASGSQPDTDIDPNDKSPDDIFD